jgi:hypothetical protein
MLVYKDHKPIMELVGIQEIAKLASVSPQAVSNWLNRHPSFPRPAAKLASGPVWTAAPVRRWLGVMGFLVAADEEQGEMTDFTVGREYSMAEIRAVLGGETMSYLPQRGSRIVCGRFTKEMNPDAPLRVLVGDPPKVQRKAELMARQGGRLPVFMKLGPGRWLYHGQLTFAEYITEPRRVEAAARKAGRGGEVAGILVFKAAD